MLKLALNLFRFRKLGDSSPGGSANALLLESGFGVLMEDGNYLLLEA